MDRTERWLYGGLTSLLVVAIAGWMTYASFEKREREEGRLNRAFSSSTQYTIPGGESFHSLSVGIQEYCPALRGISPERIINGIKSSNGIKSDEKVLQGGANLRLPKCYVNRRENDPSVRKMHERQNAALSYAFSNARDYDISPGDTLFKLSRNIQRDCPELRSIPWTEIKRNIKIRSGMHSSSDEIPYGENLKVPGCYSP